MSEYLFTLKVVRETYSVFEGVFRGDAIYFLNGVG